MKRVSTKNHRMSRVKCDEIVDAYSGKSKYFSKFTKDDIRKAVEHNPHDLYSDKAR